MAATALVAGLAGPAAAAVQPPAPTVSVIVRELPGAGNGPETAVAAAGGTVGRALSIIDGFSAQLPADRIAAVRAGAGVLSVSEDAAVSLHSTEVNSLEDVAGSMYWIAQEVTGAGEMWNDGFTGRGVDVAVIDSGVVPVDGLRTPGKVVYGPDLSVEAQACDAAGCSTGPAANLDSYGHGTHMAGIIAGRDDATPSRVQKGEQQNFVGMAPDARIVSVKVADAAGATDVSQVIAAIDWVVSHRNRNGLNIRVLNLSFGTDGVQNYQLDPLTYAAEVAWRWGIVVVVAAGNGGYGTAQLNNPAYDPYLLAVGGSDGGITHDVSDDVIPAWSSTGDGTRNPDLVAPGASVVSLRSPGSYLDATYPQARTGSRFFRGSGTSQAAAVVSGAAVLLISQRPGITPDQLKALLTGTAQRLPAANPTAQGAGQLDLERARDTATPVAVQTWPRATGVGSLDAARGSAEMALDGVPLAGEFDITGGAWAGAGWAVASAAGTTWAGTGASLAWNGRGWFGHTWNADSWTGHLWNGGTWIQAAWVTDGSDGSLDGSLDGKTWSGKTWSGKTWSAGNWGG